VNSLLLLLPLLLLLILLLLLPLLRLILLMLIYRQLLLNRWAGPAVLSVQGEDVDPFRLRGGAHQRDAMHVLRKPHDARRTVPRLELGGTTLTPCFLYISKYKPPPWILYISTRTPGTYLHVLREP